MATLTLSRTARVCPGSFVDFVLSVRRSSLLPRASHALRRYVLRGGNEEGPRSASMFVNVRLR